MDIQETTVLPASEEEFKHQEPPVLELAQTVDETPWGELSFQERLMRRFGITNVTEKDVYTDFMNMFTDEDLKNAGDREALFDRLADEFRCELGRVSQRHPSEDAAD